MRYFIIGVATSLLSWLAFAKTSGQLCRGTSTYSKDGNWYCSEVQTITYRNISQSGAYNRTTHVDPDTGRCSHETVSYSGTDMFTPLLGELSMHLRGPMNVSQIAVYTISDNRLNGRSVPKHKRETPNRRTTGTRMPFKPSKCNCSTVTTTATTTVTVTVTNTNCVSPQSTNELPAVPSCPCRIISESWTSNAVPSQETQLLSQPLTSSSLALSIPSCRTTLQTQIVNVTASRGSLLPNRIPTTNTYQPLLKTPCWNTTEIVTPNATVSSLPLSTPQLPTFFSSTAAASSLPLLDPLLTLNSPPMEQRDAAIAASGAWSRLAYYTSTAPAEATGFAFLANLGDPQKSGTFDYSFGNSLGYVSSDGGKVVSENTPFDGTLESSEIEIAAFTDRQCETDCEYARPMSTAYHGWAGKSKAFFIEFQMDHYDNRGTDQGLLSDAPAWWFLNAAIPRVLQYGNDRDNIPCSCWSTGCGEFDAFEVLGKGEERAKSTVHRKGNIEGGDSNWFARPVGRMMKFAVVVHQFNITAAVLDDGFAFEDGLSEEQIQDIVSYDPNSSSHSLFAIGA